MKGSFNVLISLSAALRRCIPRGAIWKYITLYLSSPWNAGDDSFFSIMYAGLCPLVSRCSCRYLMTGLTCCLISLSWGGFKNYCYRTCIEQIFTWFPYFRLQVNYLLNLLIFASCGWWSWWTLCWFIVPVVSLVDSPVSLALVYWWTWCSSMFGACVHWMFPLMGVYAC